MKHVAFSIILLTIAAAPIPAEAQICGQDGFDIEGATLARVMPVGRVPFIHGAEIAGCPSLADQCQEKAYLVSGDIVVTQDPVGGAPRGLVCVDFTRATGRSHSNWIARTAIEPLSVLPGTIADWLGEWRRPESNIRIRRAATPGMLAIAGAATYGADDPARVARGAVNDGSIAALITPRNARASFGMSYDGSKGARKAEDLYGNLETFIPFAAVRPGDCGVQLRLAGQFLLIKDNGDCGGNNVTFTGVYSKQAIKLRVLKRGSR